MLNDAPGHDAAGAAPDWDAVARYLAGESPADEAQRVRAWLENNPAERELVESLAAAGAELPLAPVDVDAALDRVHARMRNQMVAYPERSARGRAWRAGRIAALALAAALVGIVVLRHARTPAPASVATTYATAIGARDSIQLADGSHVILGPASRLVVPANYGTTTRTVDLTGDAYFDVRHDPATPFGVRVAHAYIEDVGTRFNVESDGGDTTSVAVLGGSVRLQGTESGTAGIVLTAGDRGSVADGGPAVRDSARAGEDDIAWASGRLVFRDASLVRVAGELRRWYGVRLVFGDSSLPKRRLTASFQGESAEEVLRTIGLTLGVHVDLQGDSAVVSTTH
ncbi:MAG TPA: FecR domain-containing protein [Gemmatimonadaceae bacterium]|nr:FecR domain-containing protein [Gemmatimonadaceae bacterium]